MLITLCVIHCLGWCYVGEVGAAGCGTVLGCAGWVHLMCSYIMGCYYILWEVIRIIDSSYIIYI